MNVITVKIYSFLSQVQCDFDGGNNATRKLTWTQMLACKRKINIFSEISFLKLTIFYLHLFTNIIVIQEYDRQKKKWLL
jgi:hypothetical protein